MYELREVDFHLVGGGTSSGSSQPATQVCASFPNGTVQCTSSNGRSLVIQSYDGKGNLTSTTVCTDNRSASLEIKAGQKAGGGIRGGGGSSCTTTHHSGNSSSQGSAGVGQLVIQDPFSYVAP